MVMTGKGLLTPRLAGERVFTDAATIADLKVGGPTIKMRPRYRRSGRGRRSNDSRCLRDYTLARISRDVSDAVSTDGTRVGARWSERARPRGRFSFRAGDRFGDSESFSRRKSFPSYICTGKQSPTFSFPRRHESVRQIGDDRDTADSPKSLEKFSHRKKARSPSAQWRSIRRRPSQHSPPDVKCVKSKTPENATRVCVASTSTHTQRAYAERAADGNIATIGARRQCRAPRRATEAGA